MRFSAFGGKVLTPSLQLGERTIHTFNGVVCISPAERREIVFSCQTIWQGLLKQFSYLDRFWGLIRFDLVPGVKHFIWGVYEVNMHAPECAAATATLHASVPRLAGLAPSATQRVAKGFPSPVTVVPGDGTVKREWGPLFFEALRREGVSLRVATPEEVMRDPPETLWRWGGARLGLPRESQYSQRFVRWLYRHQEEGGRVFNTMPPLVGGRVQDASSKGALMPRKGEADWNRLVGNNYVLGELGRKEREELLCSLPQEKYLVKPLRGGHGEGITFGELVSPREWRGKILSAGSNMGLFEARWLPRVEIGGRGFAHDLNATFWVAGGELDYRYTIVRMDDWKRYRATKIINVARGGGYAGTVIDW